MNDTENDNKIKSKSSETKEIKKRKPERRVRKTQGQMIQEALGLKEGDIKDIEKKLFIVRFLDFFSEETLQFIFMDNTLNQYIKQVPEFLDSIGLEREEDRLIKQGFESKDILGIINKLKSKAEELAISKGVKTSVEKRLRKIS